MPKSPLRIPIKNRSNLPNQNQKLDSIFIDIIFLRLMHRLADISFFKQYDSAIFSLNDKETCRWSVNLSHQRFDFININD